MSECFFSDQAQPIEEGRARALGPLVDRSLEERTPNACWIYSGPRDRQGYGRHRIWLVNDPRRRRRRQAGYLERWRPAHRIAWELWYGRPPRAYVLHRCDNPPCVRPTHLFEGTAADNSADMMRKGRWVAPPGPESWCGPRRHLGAEERQRILQQRASGATIGELSRAYGRNRKTISDLVNGRTYRPSRIIHPRECPQGHPYSGGNVRLRRGTNYRICRTCDIARKERTRRDAGMRTRADHWDRFRLQARLRREEQRADSEQRRNERARRDPSAERERLLRLGSYYAKNGRTPRTPRGRLALDYYQTRREHDAGPAST